LTVTWFRNGCAVLLATLAIGGANAATVDLPDQTANATVSASGELTLIEAIARALSHNFALLAGAQNVAISTANVGIARGALLPQVDMALHGSKIDSDRAVAGIGRTPEYQSFASASLQQMLYSDKKVAAYQVQRILEASRKLEQEARVLDTVLATAVAYLDLLRAVALLEVDRENLKVTEANYQRRIPACIGVGIRSEVSLGNRSAMHRQRRCGGSHGESGACRFESHHE
jgi:outer membrane protein TolC